MPAKFSISNLQRVRQKCRNETNEHMQKRRTESDDPAAAAAVVWYLDGFEEVVAGHLRHAVVREHHVDGLLLLQSVITSLV